LSRLQYGHGAADELHVRRKRPDCIQQELSPPSHLVEDVSDHRGEQLIAQAGEQGFVVHLDHALPLP
jgi:hypothetical protein